MAAHLLLAVATSGTPASACGGRIDVKFLSRPHLCRTLSGDGRASCEHFFVRLDSGIARPCGDWLGDGNCTAGPTRLCAAHVGEPTRTPSAADLGPKAKAAFRRRRRLMRRSVARKLGVACHSAVEGDTRDGADCEEWCDPQPRVAPVEPSGARLGRGGRGRRARAAASTEQTRPPSLAPCKMCKCRACRVCESPVLPKWATRTVAGVRASCELFGQGVCNASGQLDATLKRVEAEAYQKWLFNHSAQWINALFETSYRLEAAVYRALAPSLPRLVAAEEDLGSREMEFLQRGAIDEVGE